MPIIAKNNISFAIVMFVISLFMILIGIVLTVSLVFIFIGLPLLIIGVILLIMSIFAFFSSTLGRALSVFKGFHGKKHKRVSKKDNIIDVHEKDGIYK